MPEADRGDGPRLAILSFSSGEYDARSFRVARSAVEAGYRVRMYARWSFGQPLEEERDGYTLTRIPHSPLLAFPGVRSRVRRRLAARVAKSEQLRARTLAEAGGAGGPVDGARAGAATTPAPSERGAARGLAGRVLSVPRRWRRMLIRFPFRPMGWAIELERTAPAADIWHGMWAGSLPGLLRLQRRHGGRTIYDSRDVLMLSREYLTLEWPIRPVLVRLERRWARRVDRVVTVNEACADLLATSLRVRRPEVVLNTPVRWTPPDPPPDLIRERLGLAPATRIVLYQGQLNTQRGIEQAAEAVLSVPDAVLVLLGFGALEAHYRRMAQEPPYAGRLFLLPAVAPSELLWWTASADVLVMAIQPTSPNHALATPQKLWEALAAGVPVVASDLPGMAGVVGETGAGTLCDPTSPASIADALRRVLDASPGERTALRAAALRAAHDQYNWESQATVLLALYDELLGRGVAAGGATA